MTEEILKAKIIIYALAKQKNIPEAELRREMEDALEQVWRQIEESGKGERLFPEGKPSLEVFIIRIAELFP